MNFSIVRQLATRRARVQNGYFLRRYHENILDHYENPRNVGSLNKNSKYVGTGLVGAPACGDVMKLQVLSNLTSVSCKCCEFFSELLCSTQINALPCQLNFF